jgi:hypothetical protein
MKPKQEERLTKIILISFFLAVMAVFAKLFGRKHESKLNLSAVDLFLLATSTFRLGRLVAYNEAFEPIRSPVAKTVPDDSGAGKTTEPKQKGGALKSLGQLVTCPICSGTWIAAGLTYALHLWPGATRVFLVATSSIGSAELLNAVQEFFSWSSQASRKAAGEE